MSSKHQPRQKSKVSILREKGAEIVGMLVPEWSGGDMTWDRVAQVVGDSTLDDAGLLDHRADCTHVAGALSAGDVVEVGAILAGGPGNTLAILSRYVKEVPTREVAAQWKCPVYIVSSKPALSHQEYHALLDLHADTVAWKERVRAEKDERKHTLAARRMSEEALKGAVIGHAEVRAGLGLAQWQMHQAFESGLFTAGLPRNGVFAEEYAAAISDVTAFKYRLGREDRINISDVAKMLGVVRGHAEELVAEGVLRACGQGTFKWGTFYLYRRGDVEDLLSDMPVRIEERRLVQMGRRIEAGQAAARRRGPKS